MILASVPLYRFTTAGAGWGAPAASKDPDTAWNFLKFFMGPAGTETEDRIQALREKAHALAVQDTAPRPLILGRHLVELGLAPGPAFKPILDAAFEMQLEGAFSDEASGRKWLEEHLRQHPAGKPTGM